jgi:histidyl-tRNA synthetase
MGDGEDLLAQAAALMAVSESAMCGVEELREVIASIRDYGVHGGAWKIDLSIARGLAYYTGPIFETQLLELPSIGSVFSGGRYDKLVGKFCGTDVPAVGASVGVDRILDAMEALKMGQASVASVQAMILTFDPACMPTYRRIAGNLRRAGVCVELYMGGERSIKRQLSVVNDRKIPYAIIVGSDEVARGVVQVKDLNLRTQKEVPEGELLQALNVLDF